ncbi:MAG: RNA-binding S4 domain-containing protein [Brumimicrobium sp.]|nr:RNA-binding S4 domain-containing protein [Brumimicrobium sp.]
MSNEITFNLEGPYIELIQLLKATGLAQTGGHAKMIVDEGQVNRNGEIETRRRAKIIKGDELIVGKEIHISIQ